MNLPSVLLIYEMLQKGLRFFVVRSLVYLSHSPLFVFVNSIPDYRIYKVVDGVHMLSWLILPRLQRPRGREPLSCRNRCLSLGKLGSKASTIVQSRRQASIGPIHSRVGQACGE